jgi:hypothetical protein
VETNLNTYPFLSVSQVVGDAADLEHLKAFVFNLMGNDWVSASPMAMVLDHIHVILNYNSQLPDSVRKTLAALSAAPDHIADDSGLAAVFAAVPQGKRLIDLANIYVTTRGKDWCVTH